MKAIKVTCPQCGAVLDVGDAAQVTCAYCGTPAVVQRRSKVLDRVLPPSIQQLVESPARYALQVRTISWAAIGIVFAAIALAAIGITCVAKRAVEASRRQAATKGGGVTPAPGRMLGWEGDSGGLGLIEDADGDGDPDVIGRCREYGNVDAVTLVALDGKTGATIWESEKLGTYSDTYLGLLTVSAGILVFADDRAQLRAYLVDGGTPLWKTSLPERVKSFCYGLGMKLVVTGKDDVVRPLNLADGKPATDAEASRSPSEPICSPMPHDHDGGDLTSVRTDAPYDLAESVGMSTAELVTGPTGARVLSGIRAKGTGVPRLVAIDDHDKARWSVDVPAEPLAASERRPELVAVGADLACASYELNDSKPNPHVVCFGLADGARRWDVELTGDDPLEGLQLTEVGVLIAQWALLEVRDPADGKLRWKYGGI